MLLALLNLLLRRLLGWAAGPVGCIYSDQSADLRIFALFGPGFPAT